MAGFNQWGIGYTDSDGNVSVVMPIAFKEINIVNAMHNGGGAVGYVRTNTNLTKISIKILGIKLQDTSAGYSVTIGAFGLI